ncbi:hypothetical protein Sjap_006871 [Stephania japonica]|uniref:Uncharacterized protein n=1 Tax=Stephania japonica TaxID=461633 RepID=A0AAP0K6N4_9MAGN
MAEAMAERVVKAREWSPLPVELGFEDSGESYKSVKHRSSGQHYLMAELQCDNGNDGYSAPVPFIGLYIAAASLMVDMDHSYNIVVRWLAMFRHLDTSSSDGIADELLYLRLQYSLTKKRSL